MLEQWDGHCLLGELQDPALATRAPRLKKSDGAVDWSQSAERIYNQVRALRPWPGTYTQWQRGKGPDASDSGTGIGRCPTTSAPAATEPGQVVRAEADQLWIGTGAGCLAIHQIHPAGKRAMSVREFLRGNPVQVGDRFGD